MNIDRDYQRRSYLQARQILAEQWELLEAIEHTAAMLVANALADLLPEAQRDYDEASELLAFWKNYPPQERGRQPRGDQYPWIEVGEHSIGVKLARELGRRYESRDTGFPTGPDQRMVIRDPSFADASRGLTDAVWLTFDIKSAGPRDDFPHTVMSPNQISGSGEWPELRIGVQNSPMIARGLRTQHSYQPMLPPLLVLSDGLIAPTVTLAVKPVYAMDRDEYSDWLGQTLERLHLITIPNGLLLSAGPRYLDQMPGLLFPGKDDATVPLARKRARVSMEKLEAIAGWRNLSIYDRAVPRT